MMDLLTKRMQSFAQQEWLHKSIRTLLAVAPGLSFFVTTGDQRGVTLGFPWPQETETLGAWQSISRSLGDKCIAQQPRNGPCSYSSFLAWERRCRRC
jgi:hypothetical protein